MKKQLSRIFLTEFFCIWVFWSLLAVAIITLQYFSAAAELRITAKANRIGTTQVFWHNKANIYQEKLSAKRRITLDYEELKFPLKFTDTINFIRLDPLKDRGTVEITAATLYQPFHKSVDMMPALLSGNLVPIQQASTSIEGGKLFLKSEGQDPAFEIKYTIKALSPVSIMVILTGCLTFAAVTSVLLNQRLLKGDKLSGTLSITLEKDQKLTIPDVLSSSRGYIQTAPNQEIQRRYCFDMKQLPTENLLQLLSEIRSANPKATTVFHYNRTGEV
ncbi:hypothetical protein [Desulfopila sp. IMCC35008]|uniref:hypothetical protein n=1 Tax=Desulfopila sp. IMCC35008 TaxID=2653858 RepID=UPI0013CFA76A|nr:hypothetical protein [Desulfopila sp. IMCC35008]